MKLRSLAIKDAPGMMEWMIDPKINKFFRFSSSDINIESAEKFIIQAQIEMSQGSTYHYAITNNSDEYLGTISLKKLDDTVRCAEFAISLRSNMQGQGIATWATKEILYIAFEKMNLYRIYLNVLSENLAAIKLYEKVGFIYEGEFRNHINVHGEIKSIKWYAMLKKEYFEKKGTDSYEN